MPAGTERGASAVAVVDRRVYVAGGYRMGGAVPLVSVYDSEQDAWSPLPDLPVAKDHVVGAAVEKVVYVIGGRNSMLTGSVDALEPGAWSWNARSPMRTPRAGAAAGVLLGHVVVAGGEGNAARPDGIFVEVEAYDPKTDAWTSLPPMKTPRHGTGGAVIDDVLYIPGGATRQGFGAVSTHEALAP